MAEEKRNWDEMELGRDREEVSSDVDWYSVPG